MKIYSLGLWLLFILTSNHCAYATTGCLKNLPNFSGSLTDAYVHSYQSQHQAQQARNTTFLATTRTVNGKTVLPNNSLYHINPQPGGYLVETDPKFTNNKRWLGSDYMLQQLQLDPQQAQKRIGDAFYEQRLINEQIVNQTGYRRLAGYQNDEEQFKALMDNGATVAKQFNLTPGIALSAAQVAQLTSNIV